MEWTSCSYAFALFVCSYTLATASAFIGSMASSGGKRVADETLLLPWGHVNDSFLGEVATFRLTRIYLIW